MSVSVSSLSEPLLQVFCGATRGVEGLLTSQNPQAAVLWRDAWVDFLYTECASCGHVQLQGEGRGQREGGGRKKGMGKEREVEEEVRNKEGSQ